MNPAALGLEDLDVEAVERKALARHRHAADARQHVAADRFESAVLDPEAFEPEAVDELFNRDLAAQHVRVVSLFANRLRFEVVFVPDLTDELFDDVLDGDEA